MRPGPLIKLSLIMCIVLPAAAFSQEMVGTAPASGRVKPGPAPSPAANQIVTKAFQNMFAAKSFRARGEVTRFDGASFDLELEFLAPNRLRLVVRSNQRDPDLGFEVISIGTDAYAKLGGKWSKHSLRDRAFDFYMLQDLIDDVFKEVGIETSLAINLNNIRFEMDGPGAVNGTPITVYRIISPDEGTVNVSIGTSDILPYKIELELPVNRTNSPTEKLTLIVTDYNTAIKIEPPM